MRISLANPSRPVAVTVEQSGSPVAGAKVRVGLGYNIELEAESDAQGVASFNLLPDQELSSVTAWTDDHRVGSFQFSRKPMRNPDDDTHVVELFDCRDVTIRFVDPTGKPVEGVAFEFNVATPAPNFNCVGLVEPKVMTTAASGEALYRWLPDWESHHFYLQLVDGTGWVLEGAASDSKQADGALVYNLKPAIERNSVTGRVEPPEGAGMGGLLCPSSIFSGRTDRPSRQ